MKKINVQRSRFYCSNLYAIITDLSGNHIKDCKTKGELDSYKITHRGIYIIISNSGVQRFISNTILNHASLN
jgi:hypothetical protein